MKQPAIFNILFFALIVTSCEQGPHFITDPEYRKKVATRFEVQYDLAKHRSDALFNVLKEDLSKQEFEACQFLYAYMPLSDLADYDGRFFLKNVKSSFAARDTFSWGDAVPEELFRHFVLPVRVNNETLDSSRWLFFSELKDRIKNMTMKEAALEVNHWCHEKVTYKASDSRTSSPLATVTTATGRCGEESTFTVAAMRSVGIPARQCYTPRWAHSDDNHAWVEVWVDGQWNFLGACEPEPDLNMAWFTAPVKRAMLVTTNVFGDYSGTEDILVKDPRYTRINILSNYTDTKRITAVVRDRDRNPVNSAVIEFQLYNYAEFYPLHRSYTDQNGTASLLTGLGDLLIWASKGGKFGFFQTDVRTMDTVIIVLDHEAGLTGTLPLDLIPPPRQQARVQVSDSLTKINTERLSFEDQIRSAYEATFPDSARVYRMAETMQVDPDTLWDILKQSRGNWREIIHYLAEAPEDASPYVFPLLYVISQKDLRDVRSEVLLDVLANSHRLATQTSQSNRLPNSGSSVTKMATSENRDFLINYVMNPRVDHESLKPFHTYLSQTYEKETNGKPVQDPETIVNWVKKVISVDDKANYSRAPLTPAGVFALKVSDAHSRDIFFVAICRSLSIPARLEPATRIPQYYDHGQWNDVYFSPPEVEPDQRTTIVLSCDPDNSVIPEYYIHYTIGQLKEGFYRTLDYEYDPRVVHFPATLDVVPGSYLVVTGNRLSDGTVLADLNFLTATPHDTTHIPVKIRRNMNPPSIYGGFDPDELIRRLQKGGIRIAPGQPLIMAWIEPDKEPTKHFLGDLVQKAKDFGQWNGTIILFCPSAAERDRLIGQEGKQLPENVVYPLNEIFDSEQVASHVDILMTHELPLVIYMNVRGEINYISEGYRIGIGDDLIRLISYSKH